MSERPDHLDTALDSLRAQRARDEGERARLMAVAAKYREFDRSCRGRGCISSPR